MQLNGNIFNELESAYSSMLLKSELNRLAVHTEFAAFYNNDYESICGYLQKDTLNNPFSAETLKELKFRHVNVTGKIINRVSSGIFIKDPVIKLVSGNENEQKLLSGLLNKTKFISKVKDAFRKAVYFNTVEANVVWDENKKDMRIDVITPDNCTVETGSDYLEKIKIAVRKADENGEIYWSVWTDTEHYLIKGDKKYSAENNPGMINPFAGSGRFSLPFAVLRIEEGSDYWGEPNWNIFLHQKNLDIRLTDLNESELKTLHQIYLGINTNFTEGESFRAGDFKQINNVNEEDKEPKIESVVPGTDHTSVRENIDWLNRLVLQSEGITGSAASTELKAESGAAKVIDELELLERREEYKTLLYHFMQHLLEVIRVVWNYYNPQNRLPVNKGFEIRFTDARIFESLDDRKKRYDMALEYGYKDKIDIAAEELEVSEEEAAEIIKTRKERNGTINNVQ